METWKMKGLERITFNPDVMGGKPTIRGMRVTVGTIVGLLAAGHSQDEILRAYACPLRTQDILPGGDVERMVLIALREHQAPLEAGALIVLDQYRLRARILPLRR